MKLRTLRIKNFLSFGDEPQKLDFDSSPLSFVVGPNNSGKSNLFRALGFVGEAIANTYPPSDPSPYLSPRRRDFEIAVGLHLDKDELAAVQDFLVCGNMMNNPGGSVEQMNLYFLKNDILEMHADELFGGLGSDISIVVEGTNRLSSPFNASVRLKWDGEELMVVQDGYFAKMPFGSSQTFGYIGLDKVLQDDFAQRYPEEKKKLVQGRLSLDEWYAPPELGKLVSSALASQSTKPSQQAFSGIQAQPLNTGQFDNQFGTTERLLRLTAFLAERKFVGETLTFRSLLATFYLNTFVWVADMRGRPPDFSDMAWERPAERPGAQFWGGPSNSGITSIAANDLPARLFGMLTSKNVNDQRRHDEIQKEFGIITDGLSFKASLDEKEVAIQVTAGQATGAAGVLGGQAPEAYKKVKVVGLRILDKESSWPARFASAGTIEMLCLLTAIVGARGQVLLLDEPAQNMHPDFQNRFLAFLRGHLQEHSNQAIVVTHSPFMIARENFDDTWRLTRRKKSTVAICVAKVLASLDPKSWKAVAQQLDSADARSLLFSRGAVFVEGLSDKWAVQESDKKLLATGEGAGLVEGEWSVVSMGGKGNAPTFLRLSELLGLDYAFLLDGDAVSIVRELLRTRGVSDSDGKTMNQKGFYLLPTDIDDLLGVTGSKKPLKALARALGSETEGIPVELKRFIAFVRNRIEAVS